MIDALEDTSSCIAAARAGLRPDPLQTIAEWSDQNVQLPGFVAESGRWRTSRTPYLREIMECLSPVHPCSKVVFMKSHQIGGTQTGVNWIGYVIDRAPGAMLVVEPSLDVAKKLSKQKVQPMLDLTPCLKGKVKEARMRDSGNSMLGKEFLGGMVVFTGANSAVGLRFMSARYLLLDEVDAYVADVDGEGHPADLAEKRTSSFARRKIFELSTPLLTETSRIEPDYHAGSRGRYCVPCPLCGFEQHLQWDDLVYSFDGIEKPHEAAYRCAGCRALIPEHHKTQMLAAGRWIHEDPDNPVRSFHINALYMPYGWPLSWAELARQWIEANRLKRLGDVRKLKAFTQTILGKTWHEAGETVNQDEIYKRRERYEAPCPEGVLYLTAAVDVQDDRLEAEIVGWGKDEESWSIEYRVFLGSPSQARVWQDLTAWWLRPRVHASGIALRVEAVGVDTGGHHTKEAYWYAKKYRGRVFALKGSNQQGAPIVPPRPPKTKGRGFSLFLVGTVAAKDTIFPRLRLAEPGPGYMHFPDRTEYDEEYFKQLASEEKKPRYNKRRVLLGYYYDKIRARNEALDLKVYNLATLAIAGQMLNVDLDRLAEQWEHITARAKSRQVEMVEASVPIEPMALPPSASAVAVATAEIAAPSMQAPEPALSSVPIVTVRTAIPRPGRRVISQGVS